MTLFWENITDNSNAKQGVHIFGPVKIENCNDDGVCTWENGAPDRSRTVIINENYTYSDEPLKVDKLVLKENKILSVDKQYLVVTNDINIETGAEIRLIGDKGKSQLIQTHEGAAKITGDGKILIDQKSNIASVYRYNYMSSPVTTDLATNSYTVGSVFKDGSTALDAPENVNDSNIAKDINFQPGYDGDNTTDPITISTRWIYTFEPAEGNVSNWKRKGKDGTILPTDGFIFKGPGEAQNYTFTGSPNDGVLETRIIGTNQSYLLGNPFSSAMSAKKFIYDNIDELDADGKIIDDKGSITGSLYFWDHVGEKDTSTDISGHYQNGYLGGYATINIAMETAAATIIPEDDQDKVKYKFKKPGTYIPVGQGFFVVGDNSGGTIEFNNSQREYIKVSNDNYNGGDGSIFYKSGKKKEKNTTGNARYFKSLPIIKLGMNALNQDDGKTYHRQIGVSFKENNSFAYDNGYDSEMFDTGKTDFYWKFPNDDNNYVISGVQAFDKDLQVPLEVVVENTADLSIMVDEVKNISSNIYILDKVTGISYDISEEKTSIHLETGTYTDRFVLAFKPSAALSLDNEVINLSTNIYVDHKNHDLIVTKDYGIDIKKVVLYNVIGETISTWKIDEHADTYRLALKRGLPAGVYLSKITTNKGINNKKIIIE